MTGNPPNTGSKSCQMCWNIVCFYHRSQPHHLLWLHIHRSLHEKPQNGQKKESQMHRQSLKWCDNMIWNWSVYLSSFNLTEFVQMGFFLYLSILGPQTWIHCGRLDLPSGPQQSRCSALKSRKSTISWHLCLSGPWKPFWVESYSDAVGKRRYKGDIKVWSY